jgi:CRISPR system Cascade subunit CasE
VISTFTDTATLTKLIVNPQHRGARDDLNDAHRMHQTLTKLACPPDFGSASRSAAGLLYRIEHTQAGISILIQTRTAIDPQHIPPGYAHGGTRDLTPLLDHFDRDTQIRYRIVANPTKAENRPGQRGRHQPLTGDNALTWWHRKANEAGLTLHHTDITDTTILRGDRTTKQPPHRTPNSRARRLAITTTTFEGTATIHNPDHTRHAILTGIGRGRAYGCGLLSLAPLT